MRSTTWRGRSATCRGSSAHSGRCCCLAHARPFCTIAFEGWISSTSSYAATDSLYDKQSVAIEFADEGPLDLDGDRLYAFGMNTPNTIYRAHQPGASQPYHLAKRASSPAMLRPFGRSIAVTLQAPRSSDGDPNHRAVDSPLFVCRS
jgi:hypothetical protein